MWSAFDALKVNVRLRYEMSILLVILEELDSPGMYQGMSTIWDLKCFLCFSQIWFDWFSVLWWSDKEDPYERKEDGLKRTVKVNDHPSGTESFNQPSYDG